MFLSACQINSWPELFLRELNSAPKELTESESATDKIDYKKLFKSMQANLNQTGYVTQFQTPKSKSRRHNIQSDTEEELDINNVRI